MKHKRKIIMDFFDVINKRYSHKGSFLSTPVPLKHLEKIAHAGLAAPSGGNSQLVKLVILPNRESVQTLNDIRPATALKTAPAAIALFVDKSMHATRFDFSLEDYSAACTQMLLAATAMGYVSLWLDSPYFGEAEQKAACELLNAPDSCRLYVVLPIGLPDGESKYREKIPFNERIWHNKF